MKSEHNMKIQKLLPLIDVHFSEKRDKKFKIFVPTIPFSLSVSKYSIFTYIYVSLPLLALIICIIQFIVDMDAAK
jgi:hypothetical protein